jgi:hypothetical protein
VPSFSAVNFNRRSQLMAGIHRTLAGIVGALLLVLLGGSHSEAVKIRKHVEIGSILVEISGDASKLVGVALLPTGGSYPLPQLASAAKSVVVPFFAIQLDEDEDGVLPSTKVLDTFLSMTNTGATDITVKVTFRRADGSMVPAFGNPVSMTISAAQTVVVSAATFLDH